VKAYTGASEFINNTDLVLPAMPHGYAELLEEAVRGKGSKIWHRVRFGLTAEMSMMVVAYLTRCGRRIQAWSPGEYEYQGAESVKKSERCRCCKWDNI